MDIFISLVFVIELIFILIILVSINNKMNRVTAFALCSLVIIPFIVSYLELPLSLKIFIGVNWFWFSLTLSGGILSKKANYVEQKLSVTVLITAYKEPTIGRTIESVLNQSYPANRIIVIDDASGDDTAESARHYPVEVIERSVNMGKRMGLAEGIGMTDTEIVAVMDSDSILALNSLHEILKPFGDPKVSAVAGNVLVANNVQNIWVRFQDAWYYSSQKFAKQTENSLGVVTCCPGVFSAYRVSSIKPYLQNFADFKWRGRSYIYGDDRDLTNIALRVGKVIYQSSVIAYTEVPNNFAQFMRQQVRWKKGWLKGTTDALKFIHRKPLIGALYFYSQLFLVLTFPFFLTWTLLFEPIFFGVLPLICLGYMIGVGFIYAIDHYLHGGDALLVRPFLGVLLIPLMNLILPYAVISLFKKNQNWGTR